jgi:hypothetical protein
MSEIDEKEIERRFKEISRFKLNPEVTARDLERTRESLIVQINTQQTSSKKILATITKFSVAAGIIIAALIFIHQHGGSLDGTTPAFARMIENTKKMPWMHVVSERYYDGENKTTEQTWYYFASKKQFLLAPNRAVWCWDSSDAQKQYYYDPHTQTLTINNLPKEGFHGSKSAFDMLETLLANWNKQETTTKEHSDKLDGRNVKVYEIVETLPDEAMSIGPSVVTKIKYRLVSDIETQLIVAGRIEHLDINNRVLARTEQHIDYPKTGPNDIYALGVPRTAKVIDNTDVAPAKETDDTKLVALDIKLPKPMFVGTLQDTRVENLEKPLGKSRPPFLAPAGTTNVALGKPVTSSDEEPIIGRLEMITDGDKEAADGSYVELGPSVQRITIDLEAMYEIYAIVVWHYHKQPQVYFDVVVQAADDADFITNVKTLFNNDIDNSAGLGIGRNMHYTETNEGKLIDAKGVKARYVRLYSNGNNSNDLNHYIEVEVYGKLAE